MSNNDKVPSQLLIGNGEGDDTQFREIQLGEKTKFDDLCVAKFLIVVTEKNDELKVSPVGNMLPEKFSPEFIESVLNKSRDRWIKIAKTYENNKTK